MNERRIDMQDGTYTGRHVWSGHLCADCEKAIRENVPLICEGKAPPLYVAPMPTVEPKSAYVMEPGWPWVARFAFGVLIGLLSAAAGAIITALSILRH